MKKTHVFIVVIIIITIILLEIITGYIQYQYFLKTSLGYFMPVLLKLINFLF